MDEEQLRLEYWEDNRSNPEFPLWVIFRCIGHQADHFDNLPYLRHSQQDLASLFKQMESSPHFESLSKDLKVPVEEMRAALWYVIWRIEHFSAPSAWAEWNRRVDEAWAIKTLSLSSERTNGPDDPAL